MVSGEYDDMKQYIVVGVILLLVGVAVAPSININVVRAASDDDFVEVSSEACGITGFGNTTVKLTREQYRNLEQYLVEFRARLNDTTTREEAVPIFNEAVVELNKYGLLPKGMSVEQVLKLINPSFNNNISQHFLKRIKNLSSDQSRNAFCLVTGQVNDSCSIYPFFNKLMYITPILVILSVVASLPILEPLLGRLIQDQNFKNLIIFLLFFTFCMFLSSPILILDTLNNICFQLSDIAPFALRNVVGIGYHQEYNPGKGYHGSTGWLQGFGLLGKREWNGSLYGRILTLWIATGILDLYFSLPGMIGFSGIKITSGENYENKFYLGLALYVRISTEPPAWPKE
jgi:hypothetical protein